MKKWLLAICVGILIVSTASTAVFAENMRTNKNETECATVKERPVHKDKEQSDATVKERPVREDKEQSDATVKERRETVATKEASK